MTLVTLPIHKDDAYKLIITCLKWLYTDDESLSAFETSVEIVYILE
jgi:hypothetical protein